MAFFLCQWTRKEQKRQTKLPTDHPVYSPNTLPPRLAQSTLKAEEANCLLALDTCRSETGSSPRPEPSADHGMTHHPMTKDCEHPMGKPRSDELDGSCSAREPPQWLSHLDISYFIYFIWASEGHSTYFNCQDAKTWPSSNSSGPEP